MIRLENGADVAVATRYYKSVISRLSLTLRPVSRPIPQMVYLCLNGFLLCIDQIMRLRCSMQPPQSIGTSAPLSRIVHLEREQQVLHVKPKHSLNFNYLATISTTQVFKLHEENKTECH
ncbi:uncharacterized protein LOC123903025 isoform X1 [Trifolium pratense]|uniref:uncharacterized protein LOC123903025 isoform X1 n=1 Tax=Trifolium pratense TaxID=57577 RepID=UPI001E690C58|nr:uncharacterized protein LOC123903025 isoform X1 [Trifolium pratense]